MSRYERQNGGPWSHEQALRDLNAAYVQNGRTPPPLRHWCPICGQDYALAEAVEVCERAHHLDGHGR